MASDPRIPALAATALLATTALLLPVAATAGAPAPAPLDPLLPPSPEVTMRVGPVPQTVAEALAGLQGACAAWPKQGVAGRPPPDPSVSDATIACDVAAEPSRSLSGVFWTGGSLGFFGAFLCFWLLRASLAGLGMAWRRLSRGGTRA